MTLRSQEKREFYVAHLAVLLHVGIEVERGIIERTRPLGVDAYGVALAVGQHRAGKRDDIVVAWLAAHGELPLAGKRDGLLSRHRTECQQTCYSLQDNPPHRPFYHFFHYVFWFTKNNPSAKYHDS